MTGSTLFPGVPGIPGALTGDAAVAAFGRLEAQLARGEPPWLAERRRRALTRFAELGLPTTKDEAWRYTSLVPVEGARLDLASAPPAEEPAEEALAPFDAGSPAAVRLVFVNGRYSAKLSRTRPLSGSARAGSLAEAVITGGESVRVALAGDAPASDGAFGALNRAFWRDGAFVQVPAGVVLTEPIHLLFVATTSTVGTGRATGSPVIQPRNLILLGRDSQASLVESYVSLAGAGHLTNVVTEVQVADGAGLEHCRIQREDPSAFHVARTEVRQGKDSRVRSCAVVLGGRLVRHDLLVRLDGEGARATLSGLAVLGGRQHLDTHTIVDHERPHGTSRQLYKGVLDGHARSVFDGRIIVRPDAQKTDAHQLNKNLLLSDGVEVDSKPQLEIFADDVKCSHGAADGQLAADALFYLASRGLGEATARTLLIWGFAREVLGHVGAAEVRAHLEGLLTERLRGGRVAEESP